MKKLVSFLIVISLLFSMSISAFAHEDCILNNNTQTSDDEEVVTSTPAKSSPIITVIMMTAWQSHKNYHTSYERVVIRQGKKHIIRYKAYPKSTCIYCKVKDYINQY